MRLFDAHFHIINPSYPLVENNGYLPPNFTIEDYITATNQYNIEGGAIVSGSFQAFDQEYLIDSLKTMGSDFFGVANIPFNITDQELIRLNSTNIAAVRFNLKRSSFENIKHIEYLSNYLYEKYAWHIEFYLDSKDLNSLKPILQNIPLFSIDHLGLSKDGLKDLYYWVEKGMKIKATGFGRIDFNPIPVMKSIYQINPKALMFGTDMPSTRVKVPFTNRDVKLIEDNFSTDELDRIFYKNALEWYRKV